MTVLAAIDDSAAARPVLNFARRLATLFVTDVQSVHVRVDGSGHSAAAIAEAEHIPLHIRDGDVASALRTEIHERGAIALVIGTRSVPAGATPAGHIALDLVQSVNLPVVVVPPHATDRPLHRILVAVEGDGESDAMRGLFEWLNNRRPPPEVIAFHAIAPSALPPFADSPVHEADAFAREFMIGASQGAADTSQVRLEMRIGDPPTMLCDTARELDADLVVMAWHRNLAGGHGRLVHEMLTRTAIPIVLLPLEPGVRKSGLSGFDFRGVPGHGMRARRR